jgi:hypothetical protein
MEVRRRRGVLRRANSGRAADAEVFADGNNVGIVDDFDGAISGWN